MTVKIYSEKSLLFVKWEIHFMKYENDVIYFVVRCVQ